MVEYWVELMVAQLEPLSAVRWVLCWAGRRVVKTVVHSAALWAELTGVKLVALTASTTAE